MEQCKSSFGPTLVRNVYTRCLVSKLHELIMFTISLAYHHHCHLFVLFWRHHQVIKVLASVCVCVSLSLKFLLEVEFWVLDEGIFLSFFLSFTKFARCTLSWTYSRRQRQTGEFFFLSFFLSCTKFAWCTVTWTYSLRQRQTTAIPLLPPDAPWPEHTL